MSNILMYIIIYLSDIIVHLICLIIITILNCCSLNYKQRDL